MAESDFWNIFEEYRSKDRMTDFYDKYAGKYDGVLAASGYTQVQQHISKLLKDHVSGDHAVILDVGCGTGTSGIYLNNAGFHSIHGTDPSEDSLKLCGNKNVYSKLFEGIITTNDRLPCNDNAYDGVACMGVITKGQLDTQLAIEEFCRIIKPGGFAALTINHVTVGSKAFMQALGEAMGGQKIELVSLEKRFFFHNGNKDYECYACLVKIL